MITRPEVDALVFGLLQGHRGPGAGVKPMDTVKQAVATAVFTALNKAASKGELVSWPVEINRLDNLQAAITVRPVDGQPRRMFIIQVKEQV